MAELRTPSNSRELPPAANKPTGATNRSARYLDTPRPSQIPTPSTGRENTSITGSSVIMRVPAPWNGAAHPSDSQIRRDDLLLENYEWMLTKNQLGKREETLLERSLLAEYIRDGRGDLKVTVEDAPQLISFMRTYAAQHRAWFSGLDGDSRSQTQPPGAGSTSGLNDSPPERTLFQWVEDEAIDPLHMYKGHRQPSRRLEHIENFLSDEDYFRCMNFQGKLYQIEEYIKHMKETTRHMDHQTIKRYQKIQEMIDVHNLWIKEETTAKPYNFDTFASYKAIGRIEPPKSAGDISSVDYQLKAMSLFKDTPLDFRTRERAPMAEVCVTEPVAISERFGADGKTLESKAYPLTKEVQGARDVKDSSARQWRATERITYAGDLSYVEAPANYLGPFVKVPKVIAEKGILARQQELLGIVKRLIAHEAVAPRVVLRNVLLQLDRGMIGERGPQDTVYSAIIDPSLRYHNPGRHMSLRAADLQFLLILLEPSWNSDRDILRFRGLATGLDLNSRQTYRRLVAFAQQVESMFENRKDLFQNVNSQVPVDIVLAAVNAGVGEGNTVHTRQDAIVYLVAMRDANRLLLHGSQAADGEMISMPLLKQHPESRFKDRSFMTSPVGMVQYNGTGSMGPWSVKEKDAFENAAFKLGRSIRNLTLDLAAPATIEGEQDKRAMALDKYMGKKYGIIAVDGHTTEQLQAGLIHELNVNQDTRAPAPDFKKLWSFCEARSDRSKRFFDLARWPLEVQSAARANEIRNSTGFQPSFGKTAKRKAAVLDNIHDHVDHVFGDNVNAAVVGPAAPDAANPDRERWYSGDTVFPFGETVWQQAWQSMKIDHDLKDVPDFAHIYKPTTWLNKTRFFKKPRLTAPAPLHDTALPALPAGWTPADPWPRPNDTAWRTLFGGS